MGKSGEKRFDAERRMRALSAGVSLILDGQCSIFRLEQVRHFSTHSQSLQSMNINIRPATVADTAVIARFNALIAAETEHITLDEGRLQKGVAALLKDSSKGLYFLAEMNDLAVGQLMITYEWSDWRNGTFWWIQSVYVEAHARETGVFKSLFEYIHSLASRRPDVCGLRLYVDENNARARQTYARLGMKESHYRMYELDFVL